MGYGLDTAFRMNLYEKLLRKSMLSKEDQNEIDRCFAFLQKPYFIVILQWDEAQMNSLNLDIQEFEMLLKIIAEEELKSVKKGTTFVHMLYRQIVAVFPTEEGTETKKETD